MSNTRYLKLTKTNPKNIVIFLKWKTEVLLIRNSRRGFLTTEQLPMKKTVGLLKVRMFF